MHETGGRVVRKILRMELSLDLFFLTSYLRCASKVLTPITLVLVRTIEPVADQR